MATTESSYEEDMPKEYLEIEEMLLAGSYEGIPVSWLERCYKAKFKRSLDYKSLGVKTVEELLDKMFDKGIVAVHIHGETDERYVANYRFPTKKSVVYRDIQVMLANSVLLWIPVSCFETRYKDKYEKPLDYECLGVKTVEELLDKMWREGLVLLYEDPKSNERYVKLARVHEQIEQLEFSNLVGNMQQQQPKEQWGAQFPFPPVTQPNMQQQSNVNWGGQFPVPTPNMMGWVAPNIGIAAWDWGPIGQFEQVTGTWGMQAGTQSWVPTPVQGNHGCWVGQPGTPLNAGWVGVNQGPATINTGGWVGPTSWK